LTGAGRRHSFPRTEENLMKPMLAALATAAFVAFAPSARAELAAASSGAFLVQAQTQVAAPPDRVWRALTRVNQWWGDEHTYSGDGGRMSLDARAGGCWCEQWGRGQSVEHGRVILAMEREGVRTLRIAAGLGPLQETGAVGILTFTVAPHASGASITMSYRVTGDPGLGLDQIAPLVDMVLLEQFGRLGRYSATGSPD
jgi:uncharacterized protein YndB with AHSA1/START domain